MDYFAFLKSVFFDVIGVAGHGAMFLGRNSIFSKLYLWNMAKDLGHIIAHIEPKSKSCLKNMHRVKKAFEECWLWFTSKECRVLRHHLRKWLYFWSGSIFIILRGGFLVKIPDLSQSLDTSILELRDFLQLWIQQTILIWFERSDSYVERSVFEYLHMHTYDPFICSFYVSR